MPCKCGNRAIVSKKRQANVGKTAEEIRYDTTDHVEEFACGAYREESTTSFELEVLWIAA